MFLCFSFGNFSIPEPFLNYLTDFLRKEKLGKRNGMFLCFYLFGDGVISVDILIIKLKYQDLPHILRFLQ
jgi:hypothetical protein